MDFIKKNWKSAVVGALLFFSGILGTQLESVTTYFTEEALEDQYEANPQIEEFILFEETSGIIDHKFEDGKLFFKYKTCNPPEQGDYKYRIYINGEPTSAEIPEKNWYRINDWIEPIHCTEGWWGRQGWAIPDHHSAPYRVRVIWNWRLRVNDRDQKSYHTKMEYNIHEEIKK